MNLSVNKNTVSKSGKFFHGGINENVELVSLTRGPSKADGTGNMATIALFTNGDNEFRSVWFDIDEERIKENATTYPRNHYYSNRDKGYVKGQPVTPAQAVEMKYQEYADRLYDLLKAYIPEDSIILDAANYDALVAQANQLLNGAHIGKQVRLKLVYINNYLSLPTRNYIEPMSVNPPTVEVGPYDKIEKKDAPANPEHPADAEAAPGKEDDLPF